MFKKGMQPDLRVDVLIKWDNKYEVKRSIQYVLTAH